MRYGDCNLGERTAHGSRLPNTHPTGHWPLPLVGVGLRSSRERASKEQSCPPPALKAARHTSVMEYPASFFFLQHLQPHFYSYLVTMTANRPLRLLTVGDGDLSFSLSLKRAYPEISVTASTLVESPTELCKLYSNAANNSAEFKESWKEQIIYKVDATHLKTTIRDNYDLILFNHPHLGDSSLLKSESLAAQRHFSLLCHYFLLLLTYSVSMVEYMYA